MTTTRTDQLTSEIQATFEKELATASKLGATDVSAMMTAVHGIQDKIAAQVKTKIADEKTAHDALAENERAGKTALETHIQDLFGTLAETIKPMFEKLTTVGQVVCRLDKDKDDKITVNIVVGNLSKVTSTGHSRNHKMTVDGKQYDTVSLAWKGVMGDVPQPSKEVGADKHQSFTRDVAEVALKAAGHTVS